MWFQTAETGTVWIYTSSPSGASKYFIRVSSGFFSIGARNAASTFILNFGSTVGDLDDGSWHHICWCYALTDPAKVFLFIDDVDRTNSIIHTNDTIDYSEADHVWNGLTNGSQKAVFNLADPIVRFDEYFDVSIEANRRKLVGVGATTSVDPGAMGSLPSGTSPIMFFSGPTASWHTNKGTGGGFTENGALTDAVPDPPASDLSVTGGATFNGSGRLQANSSVIRSASIALQGASNLSLAAGVTVNGSWRGAGQGSLAAGSQVILLGSTALEGDSGLDVAALIVRSAKVTLNGIGKLSAIAKSRRFKSVRGLRQPWGIYNHRPRS